MAARATGPGFPAPRGGGDEDMRVPFRETLPNGDARRIYRVRGTVQGVGFRPFVFRAAVGLGLRGIVRNDADGVVIDAEGSVVALDALQEHLQTSPPPRAAVEQILIETARPGGLGPFAIAPSAAERPVSARVSPDLAMCGACAAEIDDPDDRRHRYPFTNCTDCGPRYSIARAVPYDRSRTTMSAFAMCERCAAEYDDPLSRRFHAQPNACPVCGPRIWLVPAGAGLDRGGAGAGIPSGAAGARTAAGPVTVPGSRDGKTAIQEAVDALGRGAIVAIKGLAGFHLACDARSWRAVGALRSRKHRPDKPFAVMFPDERSLAEEAVVSRGESEILNGARRPIVLLAKRACSTLATGVAPLLSEIGAFLPATPLHHLLLSAFGGPLVMTSGNLSDEPLAAGNDEALRRLGGIADTFLLHDRDIHTRADDSVVRLHLGRERVVRRARGYAPEAIDLGFDGPDVLAVGADLKNTLCLTTGGAAVLSQHIGDLEVYEAQLAFTEAGDGLERLFQARPRAVAHDLHPGYHSTTLARRTGLPAMAVQHHHAHIASCLVDNGRRERVIGVAWDGTGFGPDGTVWGGEFLIADLGSYERVGRIRPVALAGGDAAVAEPWRLALAHAMASGIDPRGLVPDEGVDGASRALRAEGGRRLPSARSVVEAMLREGVGVARTSSAGRLFDAIASLCGLRHHATYEGQAAVELEAVSETGPVAPYPLPQAWVLAEDAPRGVMLEIDPRPLVRSVVADIMAGAARGRIGGRFHAALAEAIGACCETLRDRTRIETVALSGGCFQSRLLTALAKAQLERRGFEVLLHARVPPNDGGIALGQAAIASWRLTHGLSDLHRRRAVSLRPAPTAGGPWRHR